MNRAVRAATRKHRVPGLDARIRRPFPGGRGPRKLNAVQKCHTFLRVVEPNAPPRFFAPHSITNDRNLYRLTIKHFTTRFQRFMESLSAVMGATLLLLRVMITTGTDFGDDDRADRLIDKEFYTTYYTKIK